MPSRARIAPPMPPPTSPRFLTLPADTAMSKRGTVVSCLASLGLFALGATLGAQRTRRRLRRAAAQATSPLSCSLSNSPPESPRALPHCDSLPPTSVPLDCPVCLTELVLPRVATCGHTLCTSCLAALFEHERRPACPVCRKRIRLPPDKLPVNFMVKSCVEARVAERGSRAWDNYQKAEEDARLIVHPDETSSPDSAARQRANVVANLRPAWNWFKWTVIIVTEFGAFLVSLKEVLESAPTRTRRYQRIV